MSRQEESAALRDKAAKCRRLAAGVADDQTAAALRKLAESYERQANELDGSSAMDDAD